MAKKKEKHIPSNPVSLITYVNPSSPVSEQYRTIRTNIQFASAVNQRLKTLVVTSSSASEGKSTTAANLAVVFANSGQRVLLVDADLRKPTIYQTFHLGNSKGLSTVLSSEETILETAQKTTIENLSVLTSGPKPPNPSELLGTVRMNQVLEEAQNLYDIVIFDMPPVVAVTDAQIIASKTDGTLLVVRENVTQKEAITKAKDLLKMVNARILGVVYNGMEQSKDEDYYYYSK